MLRKKDRNIGVPEIIKFLSSMKLGLFLFFFLGVLMSLGTLIPQGRSEVFYRTHYGELVGSFILLLSLDHLYSAWWFVGLGIFFALNIVICAVNRIKISSKNLRLLGSLLLHLSLLIIIVGAFIFGLTGHSAYLEVGVGDSVDLSSKGFPQGLLTVKDFRIEYYDTMEPKQYVTNLTLTTSTGETIEREVMVNHPLKADGLKIYQVHYGWMVRGEIGTENGAIPFDLVSGEEVVVDPSTDTRLRIVFVPDFDFHAVHSGMYSKSPLPNNPRALCVFLRDNRLMDLQVLSEGETIEVGGYSVTFSDYRYYTGLEVKREKGSTVVFAGFVLLTLGIAVRYLFPLKGHQRGETDLWK